MLFSILDSKFNDELYNKKMRLNPSNDVPPTRFTIAFRKWIINVIPKVIATKFILLDTYYKYDRLNDMAKFLNVVDKRRWSHICRTIPWVLLMSYQPHTQPKISLLCGKVWTRSCFLMHYWTLRWLSRWWFTFVIVDHQNLFYQLSWN